MTKSLATFFVSMFSFLGKTVIGKNITIFIISMLPVLELRGGMIAACLLGLNPYTSLVVCILANIIPIPFILWFITPIFDWFKKKKFFQQQAHGQVV